MRCSAHATGFRLFPRWDSPPTEHASLSLVALLPGNSTVNPVNDLDTCYLQRYADVINVKPGLIQLSFEFSDNSATSERLACSVGGESHRGKSRNPVACAEQRIVQEG